MKTKPQLKTYKNYINNQWIASKKTREVVNPFNGDTIAAVAQRHAFAATEVTLHCGRRCLFVLTLKPRRRDLGGFAVQRLLPAHVLPAPLGRGLAWGFCTTLLVVAVLLAQGGDKPPFIYFQF